MSGRAGGHVRALLWPGIAALAVLAVLVSLGTWQLSRKEWKEGLLAQIQSRAFGPPGEPLDEAGWPRWPAEDDVFRRVRLQGTFLHGQEVLVHGLAEDRPGRPLQGAYVFTPLRRADGSIIVVNRGFVPTELRDPASRVAGQPKGPVSVTGLVRAPETRGWFVPENDVARDAWFVRDLGEMARARGLERVGPFYVDADATPNPGGWPRGGQTRLVLANNHLQYAITWYGLAGTLVAVFIAFARRRRTGSGDELQPDGHAGDHHHQPGHARP